MRRLRGACLEVARHGRLRANQSTRLKHLESTSQHPLDCARPKHSRQVHATHVPFYNRGCRTSRSNSPLRRSVCDQGPQQFDMRHQTPMTWDAACL